MEKYDFSGWATRNDLPCSDGRIIRKDAFIHNDGQVVPLVWNHVHSDPSNVLGHAMLKNMDEGVYAYCSFNDTHKAQDAKIAVEHGDIDALSIYANHLKQNGPNVLHGSIKEVSLVMAGANPGAYIEDVILHSEAAGEEAIIYTGTNLDIYHADESSTSKKEDKNEGDNSVEDKNEGDNSVEENKKSEENSDETVLDIYNSMTEKQQNAVNYMIGMALEEENLEQSDINENEEDSEGGTGFMKHNVFEEENLEKDGVLSHSDMKAIIDDAKRYGSMKESFLAHAEDYGIDQIDYLFPEAKSLTNQPEFIKRDTGWVSIVMGGVHHTPFSRIKSVFADITEDEARAKGYMKGKLKKEEVFGLLKRTTTPTTVYKKQKMDRDDVIDITDFDVIVWLKGEMRVMLDEELARAYLFGDGRLASSDDKINEQNIRPVWTDEELFTVRKTFTRADSSAGDQQAQDDANARAFIRAAIKSRKDYKGSGNPIMFINEDMLTNCLLLEDKMGHIIYDTEEKLRTALRVSRIVSVEIMDDLTRQDTSDSKTHKLEALYLNLNDYNVGADKGGAVSMFDDFDIDYNQQKYLIETRCSGALVKPFSAVAIESVPKA